MVAEIHYHVYPLGCLIIIYFVYIKAVHELHHLRFTMFSVTASTCVQLSANDRQEL